MKKQQQKHKQTNIVYKNIKFILTQPENGEICITFEDIQQQYKYQCWQQLSKINYKTVIAALQLTEPTFIKAELVRHSLKEYVLLVKVTYQFLPQIEQIFTFQGERMNADRVNHLRKEKQLSKSLQNLKKDIRASSGIFCISNKLKKQPPKSHQIQFQIPFNSTCLTLNLKFNANFINKTWNNLIKISFSYFDQLTSSKLPTDKFPDQLIYVNTSSNFSLLLDSRSFNQRVISIEGDFIECDYILQLQRGIKSEPVSNKQIYRLITTVITLLIVFQSFIWVCQWLQGSGET